MQLPYLKTAFKGFLSLIAFYILSLSPALAQMRQMYLDADKDNHIKKISFYSPNEGYVAFTKWIGYTTDGGRTYTKKFITVNNVSYGSYTNINLTFGFGIEGAKAFDKNTLIVFGHYGLVPAILYSVDGGNSFKLVFHSQYDPLQLRTGIKDIVFPQNDNTGFAVDADRILKTTDKGMNWSVLITQPAGYLDHIEAVDNNIVFAFSTDYTANRLLKTSDGGTNWESMGMPQAGKLTYAYFLDINVGWLSMYHEQNRYFYKTTNGGKQWTLQNDVGATPFNCDKMQFTDVNTGYALVPPYEIYKTTNSGVTWEPLSRENDYTYLGYSHNDLQCLSATQFWAGGGHGYLEMATNGGGPPIPAAYFKTDTTGMYIAGKVQLLNFSKPGYQYQWLVNGSLVSTNYNASYTHKIYRSVDTIQLITSAGGISDTLTKYPQFSAWDIATPTIYYPKSGSAGTFVIIYGSRFSNVTGVSFGGTPAASFTVVSDTQITAVVASGSTGTITLNQSYGVIPVGEFKYNLPPVVPPPVIQAISPAAGSIGTIVTITGSGFGATVSQNKVLFGTISATLQSASSGQIVCTVPVGASLDNIQVLNKNNGLLGESPSPFSVPFADSVKNFTSNSFIEGITVNKGLGSPMGVKGSDIDGDGKPDLVVNITAQQGDSLAIYRNTTIGRQLSFDRRVNVGYIYYPTGGDFTVNDVDGDGRPDIVIPTNKNKVTVLRNISSPGLVSFENEYVVPAGFGTQVSIIADLDNDGRNDIAVTSFEENLISVIRNTSVPGALSFGATQSFNTTDAVDGIAVGDLDGDGFKDIIAYPPSTSTTGSIVLFRNISRPGNISFKPYVRVSVPGMSIPGNAIIVDYDRDGKPDIVIFNDTYICILRNKSTLGTFSFSSPVLLAIPGRNVTQGCISNFSGSDKPDVIVGNVGESRRFNLAKNTSLPGTARIDSLVYGPGGISTAIFAWAIAAADFDGDGKPDFAATSLYDYTPLIVYKNAINLPIVKSMCTSRQDDNTLGSDVSGKSYRWQQDTGTGFTNVVNSAYISGETTSALQFTNTPDSWNGYKYRCIVDDRYSSTFVLLLNATSPGIIITASDSTVCLGTNVTFTATDAISYSSNLSWQWQINGKNTGSLGDSRLITNTLQEGDQVRVILSYNDPCGFSYNDTSKAITIHVNGDTAAVQISASNLAACAGTPITFTATPKNPGSQPVYDWMVNNVSQGINNAVFTSANLKKNDLVQVFMKSTATCAYPNPAPSNVLTMAITDTSAMSVSIATTTPNVCAGTNVLFTATSQNAGPVSSYQWMVNGINTGTNAKTFNSSTLRDKDIVHCVLTSPATCRLQSQASSGTITMTVANLVIPSVSLSINDTSVCAGGTIVIAALPVNPGDAPVYQWKNNGEIITNNSPTYTLNGLTKNTTVAVFLKSSAACASPESVSSAPVLVTANPAPDVRIFGDTVVVVVGVKSHLTATTTYTGMNLQYQWQDSTSLHSWQDISGAAGVTIDYAPVKSGDKIRCVVKTYAGCMAVSNSIAIRINVITATPDPPSGATDYRYYPNPVSATLYIQDENQFDLISTITVFSALGVRIFVMNNTGRLDKININMSNLTGGMYYVETKRKSGKTRYFKFVKLP